MQLAHFCGSSEIGVAKAVFSAHLQTFTGLGQYGPAGCERDLKQADTWPGQPGPSDTQLTERCGGRCQWVLNCPWRENSTRTDTADQVKNSEFQWPSLIEVAPPYLSYDDDAHSRTNHDPSPLRVMV